MRMRIIITDDEALARERLRRLLSTEPDVEIVAECADGAAAIAAVEQHRPDLLLLDIQMPEVDGFDVLRALKGDLPEVIFITAFDEHAIRAFEARALDYLLKPTTRERLQQALDHARKRLAHKEAPSTAPLIRELLAEREAAAGRVRRFAVRNGERTTFVGVEQIDWVEAAGNYVVLHLGSESHILRETMAAMESQLPSDLFFRVSRSAILNLRRVKEIQTVSAGEYVALLENAQRVVMTRPLRELEERMRFGA